MKSKSFESDDSTEDLIIKEDAESFPSNGSLSTEPYLNYVVEVPNKTDTSLCRHVNKCLVIVVLFLITLCLVFFCLYMHVEHKLKTNDCTNNNNNKFKEKHCTTAGCVEAAAFLQSALEESIDPCKDFYLYSCGGWLQRNPIPDGKTLWGVDSVLNTRYLSSMKKLVENSSITKENTKSKSEYEAVHFYRSCTDMKSINKLGPKPLKDMLKKMGKLRKKTDGTEKLDKKYLTDLIKKDLKYGLSFSVFSFFVGLDDKNSSSHILKFNQHGLGLLEFRYKNESSKVIKAYVKKMAAVMTKLGTQDKLSENEILDIAQETFDFERQIYKLYVPKEERTQIKNFYYKATLKKLSELVPLIDWLDIMKDTFKGTDIDITESEPVILLTLKYFQRLDELLKNTSVRVFENYMIMRTAVYFAPLLTQEYIDLGKELTLAINGVYQPPPRWKMCLSSTESHMGMALSAMFVKKHFSSNSHDKAQQLVHDVRQGFLTRLNKLQWMDAQTKHAAREKANIIRQKIGYPKYILDAKKLDKTYEGLSFTGGYFDNVVAGENFSFMKSLKKLRKAVDLEEWEMTPVTINAYFEPNKNQIVFTAAIMQPPYFKSDYPTAVNYGSMGAIIGHELTHGFDNLGRQYDASGNYRSWWTDNSVKNFKENAKCYVDEYSSFTLNGLHVKGNITLGENIADNGGFKAAYEAYKQYIGEHGDEPLLPGISKTNEQVFFIAYAQSWCTDSLRSYLLKQINNDEHSPPIERVRGVIRNNEDFGRVFNCPVDSEMNPKKKCSIW